jgi:hypothetical protein
VVKNILLTFQYDCGNGHAAKYREMSKIQVQSARENLAGRFSVVELGGAVENADTMFRRIFEEEDRLYHKHPCNILVTGSDALFVRWCQIFGRYKRFMLFAPSGASAPDGLPWSLKKVYLSGTYYYPAGMPEAVWELGRKLVADWRPGVWDYIQYVYNRMYYEQGTETEEEMARLIDPRLSYNLPLDGPAIDNGIPVEEACVLHLHSSRNPDRVLEAMRAWRDTRSIPARSWANGSPSYPAR